MHGSNINQKDTTIVNDNKYKANRVVLLGMALAPFILIGQNMQAQPQQAFSSTPDSKSTTEYCRNQPVIKNLMPLRTPICNVQAAQPHELTKREAKRLASTAESREDHLKLAGYYKTQADELDAEGAGYEEAAEAYRHAPAAKNLASPTTAGRYEYMAKTFREQARSYRTLATTQEQAANNTTIAAR
jgi:hypothetical protein